jgi:hypothetical protein
VEQGDGLVLANGADRNPTLTSELVDGQPCPIWRAGFGKR